jgi:hypothetical protein
LFAQSSGLWKFVNRLVELEAVVAAKREGWRRKKLADQANPISQLVWVGGEIKKNC